MDMNAFVIEVSQPNSTVERVVRQTLGRVGAKTQASGEIADLLLCDVDALDHAGLKARIKLYERAGRPVLLCGVERLRARWSSYSWLGRPFSPQTLLSQCAVLLNISLDVPRSMPHDDTQNDFHAHRDLELPGLHRTNSSLLAQEFSLESGLLDAHPQILENTDSDILILNEDGQDIMVNRYDAMLFEDSEDHFDSLPQEFRGGALAVEPVSQSFDLDDIAPVSLVPVHSNRPLHFGSKSIEPNDATVVLDDFDAHILSQTPTPAEVSTGAPDTLPQVDEETSLEIQSFARMMAEYLGHISLSVRVQDRSDRINRILHALFERGLDGAAQELRRIPAGTGFSGQIRALSVVGLFRTMREQRLRGCLEISTTHEAWALYVDAGMLVEVKGLAGDDDLYLLQALIDQGALEPEQAQTLDLSDPHMPLEMNLRRTNLVSPEALRAAHIFCAQRDFGRVCMARDGHFAFTEINAGDAQAWPVRSLEMNIEVLLLRIMRESSLNTGVSEATSRARLLPNPTSIASLPSDAFTKRERDVLRFFQNGGTVEAARTQLPYDDKDLSQIIQRLKSAQVLLRTDSVQETFMRLSQEQDSVRRSDVTRAVNMQEATMITSSADLIESLAAISDPSVESTRENSMHVNLPRPTEPVGHQIIGSGDDEDIPTRSVKAHHIEPPLVDPLESSLLDILIDEALAGVESNEDD